MNPAELARLQQVEDALRAISPRVLQVVDFVDDAGVERRSLLEQFRGGAAGLGDQAVGNEEEAFLRRDRAAWPDNGHVHTAPPLPDLGFPDEENRTRAEDQNPAKPLGVEHRQRDAALT